MNCHYIRIWYEAAAVDWQTDVASCSRIRVEKLGKTTKYRNPAPYPSLRYKS